MQIKIIPNSERPDFKIINCYLIVMIIPFEKKSLKRIWQIPNMVIEIARMCDLNMAVIPVVVRKLGMFKNADTKIKRF